MQRQSLPLQNYSFAREGDDFSKKGSPRQRHHTLASFLIAPSLTALGYIGYRMALGKRFAQARSFSPTR